MLILNYTYRLSADAGAAVSVHSSLRTDKDTAKALRYMQLPHMAWLVSNDVKRRTPNSISTMVLSKEKVIKLVTGKIIRCIMHYTE